MTLPEPFRPALPESPEWLQCLLPREAGLLRVGIVWSDAQAPRADGGLSLGQLLPLALLPHVALFSLQTGAATAEVPDSGAAGLLTDLGSRCADALDLASAIAAMDVCVLVDGLALHLAGSLGMPTLGLLGRGAHWLHGARGEGSRWYPALRLLREESPGDRSAQLRETTSMLRGWAEVRARRAASTR